MHRTQPETFDDRTRTAIAEELRRGVPTLEVIARRLATSTRTLRRRLAELGTTFQNLLDTTRYELAKQYLSDPQLSVGEVGLKLGFSEPSAFHRAFKRWTGATPLGFRRAARS